VKKLLAILWAATSIPLAFAAALLAVGGRKDG